jgi:hypothetical protein
MHQPLTLLFYKKPCLTHYHPEPSFPGKPDGSCLSLTLTLDKRFSHVLFFVSSIFPNILCCELDLGALPALTLLSLPPPPHHTLSLSLLPFPSFWTRSALSESPVLESTTPSLAHREAPPPQCTSKCHPPLANLPSRSSLSVSPPCMQSCDLSLSHFLEILVLDLSSLSSQGTRFPTRDCGLPVVKTFPLGASHPSLSLSRGTDISGTPTISLLRSGLTMGVGPSQIPSVSPLGCLLANLGPLRLMPDLKP